MEIYPFSEILVLLFHRHHPVPPFLLITVELPEKKQNAHVISY
jgi:hypothetical protein